MLLKQKAVEDSSENMTKNDPVREIGEFAAWSLSSAKPGK
jgi:hypothetical protein